MAECISPKPESRVNSESDQQGESVPCSMKSSKNVLELGWTGGILGMSPRPQLLTLISQNLILLVFFFTFTCKHLTFISKSMVKCLTFSHVSFLSGILIYS